MILTTQESIILIILLSAGTFLTRALPFILFRNKETPGYINYLGNVIPFSAIGLLVVYCLKNVSVLSSPYGIPEAVAIIFIIILHLWKNNALLSIGSGTLIYMLFEQYVFV